MRKMQRNCFHAMFAKTQNKSKLIKIDAKIIEIGIKCILNQKEILKKFFKYLRKFNLDSRIFAKKVGVACAIAY